jgi:putative membrane protein
MFGFETGMMDSGGWSFLRNGGDVVEWHMGALGVAGAVLGVILWALVVVTLVLTIITLIHRLRNPIGSPSPERPAVGAGQTVGASQAALRILDDRYALGEISQEEYMERRRTLTGS